MNTRTIYLTLMGCNAKGKQTSEIRLRIVIDVEAVTARDQVVSVLVEQRLIPNQHRRLAAYFMVKPWGP